MNKSQRAVFGGTLGRVCSWQRYDIPGTVIIALSLHYQDTALASENSDFLDFEKQLIHTSIKSRFSPHVEPTCRGYREWDWSEDALKAVCDLTTVR